jgi:twinkle protein
MQLTEEHAAWLQGRGLEPEIAIRFGLYSEQQKSNGRVLVIPYVREGKVINHKYRGPNKTFRQDTGAPRSLWNEDILRDTTLANEPLIITEGELDGLAAIQCGFVRTVSVPDGAGTNLDFLAAIWSLLKDIPTVILAADADQPGQKLNAELARRLGAARCHFLTFPDGSKDINDVLRLYGPEAVRELVRGSKPYPVKGLYRLSDYPDVPEPVTYETPWPNLRNHLRLWHGEFCVVTGVPGSGKSLWTLNLLTSLCHNGRQDRQCAAIASFEMPTVPYVRDVLRLAYNGGEDKPKADAWINERLVFIDQDPREEQDEATVDWVLERAEDAVIRYGINWLLIDPWNQIDHVMGREGSAEYQRKAIKSIKRFARSFGVGVIVVAHPTKDVKQRDGSIRKPNGYDIDGSAHWLNAADHLLVVDRPQAGLTAVEISVRKSRFKSGGIPGSGWLRYDEHKGQYFPTIAPVQPGEF